MSKMLCCPLCQCKKNTILYNVKNVPIFQSKVYPSQRLARHAPTGSIVLGLCEECNFIFNLDFDPTVMNYDGYYESEQAHSAHFQSYLSSILKLFHQQSFQTKKLIEIGCGKGFFLEKLTQSGFNVTGFDPTYTGNNPNIIKDYFSRDYASLSAEVIVLRHVLEHIQQPVDFLHSIAEAVNYNAQIYIEVPSLDWIMNHYAFWDFFYEHCNYFTPASLGGIFHQSQQGFLFNDQYIYLIADLQDLKVKKDPGQLFEKYINQFLKFNHLIAGYQENIKKKSNVIVWGAGAKGVTFANLIDPDEKLISCLIDINPKKQNHFIPKTAHPIFSPEVLTRFPTHHVLVMNNNYYDEIQKTAALFHLSAAKIEI